MSKTVRYSLVALSALCLAALFYRIEISQFLFDPEGLSLAPDEICLTNMTRGDVIAKISVTDGATSTTFLPHGEKACSAASSSGSAGMVRVSVEDGKPPFCDQDAVSGESLKLTRFLPPSNCSWER